MQVFQFSFCFLLFAAIHCSEDARIVGGENAPPNRYPYQISIDYKLPPPLVYQQTSPGGWFHICGGSIVTKKHIVTAAHCLDHFPYTELSVLAGTVKLNGNGTRYVIEKILIHPDYVTLVTSDIGIVTISKTFVYSKKIRPITYSTEQIGGGVNCTLTGWGYTVQTPVPGTRSPNDLQRVHLPTITNEECQQRGQSVNEKEICTYSKVGQGFCDGDSGGPLAKGNLLVGVVSYGTRVCAHGRPDVYTRVSEFNDWITNNTVV